jgi:hypothetical protein
MNEAASSVESEVKTRFEILFVKILKVTIFGYVLTATWDLLTSRAKLCGGHVVLLEEAMNLLNQSELRKFIVI